MSKRQLRRRKVRGKLGKKRGVGKYQRTAKKVVIRRGQAHPKMKQYKKLNQAEKAFNAMIARQARR